MCMTGMPLYYLIFLLKFVMQVAILAVSVKTIQ